MTMALPPLLGGPALPQQTSMQLDLDNTEHAIAQLKAIRNSVIGSRTKKSNLVHTGIVKQLVQLLRIDLASNACASDLISLAATIIASLANTPAQSTLFQLIRSGTHDALICCLGNLAQELNRTKRHVLEEREGSFDALKLLESVLRALRSILLSVANQLSASPRWGIGSSWGTKAAASGVSIARPGSYSASAKIFGKSRRGSFSAVSTPMRDILMSSASHDNLRAKAKEEKSEIDVQQQRELRRLSRVFLAQVYDAPNLSLLIGSLFMCAVPRRQGPSGRSSAAPPLKAPMDKHPGPPPSTSTPSELDGAKVDVESLPMATKNKILSVIEMVCSILSSTIFIPGCPASSTSDIPVSYAEHISQRRERVLNFTVADSPFSTSYFPTLSSSRGRTAALPLQAEVIRKGSRSRSRMKDVDSMSTFCLPTWDEDGASDLLLESDLASAGPETILDVLLSSAECGFPKTSEAALCCLSELTRDQPSASLRLFRCTTPSGLLPTTVLLNLRAASSPNVRLAAFSCLANIIKVHRFTAKTNQCVLEVLMELLDTPTQPNSLGSTGAVGGVEIQIQASLAVARLVADNVTLQTWAVDDYNALQKLTTLLEMACNRAQSPAGGKAAIATAPTMILGNIAVTYARTDTTIGLAPPTIDEPSIRLREAALTALAALTFQHDEPRRKLIDTVSPPVLPLVVSSLVFPALGVRVAACRLTRALSRSISILRTSIVDAGVAQKLVELIKDSDEEEVVRGEAVAAVCNLVLDFSPMKKTVVDLGGLDALVDLAHNGGSTHSSQGADEDEESKYYALQISATISPSTTSTATSRKTRTIGAVHTGLSGSQQLRLHALWALKNLLSHSDTPLKKLVMSKLTFPFLISLLSSPTTASVMPFKEQALNILRNLAASCEVDVSYTVSNIGGMARLMELLDACIWEAREAGEVGTAVIEQAAYMLVNVATGTEAHMRGILRCPNIMDALVFFCNHPWAVLRVAGARCCGNLLSRWSKLRNANTGTDDPSGNGARAEIGAVTGEPDLYEEAKHRMRAFGLDVKLRELAQGDLELDVRERARNAVQKLDAK
ncbi:uncharacterized protein MEPE_01910 [Melanopsichium pennsylvanicum]|uniref:Armadillo repeat-containing protein 8 n=2 Tax=Melanopsichium pennsylvanicum TaxID=63383 RepID=A0AAJ5C479_9BASI|nr:arm repeat-containing protein [Melanopsichium pennsylvanicum 4]SNX83204.1 uncharacterized protein MEPE_01910 [Melanopsichium pennsylvanicum]